MTMQAAEWRICFRERYLAKTKRKKEKKRGIHELESQCPIIEGIYFRQLWIVCSDHERGLSKVCDVFILPPHSVDSIKNRGPKSSEDTIPFK